MSSAARRDAERRSATAPRRSASRRLIAAGRVVAAAALAAVLAFGAVGAQAATWGSWANWSALGGASGSFTGSVTFAQTPALGATYTSDSRGGQVGVISGSSAWLAEGTPVGAKYGSSRDLPYLNLRARADNATGASTTTYAFTQPTPPSGWAFVLGDIDADQVTIRAVGPTGDVLSAAELGFQGGFNYCAPDVAGRPSCIGDAADVPTWDPATSTLTGNAGAIDTTGAAGWFEPSQPISSLTFTFLRRSGFPVYQTWFASLARDITGTVTDDDALPIPAPAPGVTVRLIDPHGTVIGETTTDASGAYSFVAVQATDGYTVEMAPPSGKTVVAQRASRRT